MIQITPKMLLMFALMAMPGALAYGAESWHVKEAPVRFAVSLEGSPSYPSCGYFLHIPDGGILPGPSPVTKVVDESGTPLKSCVLWQNPETGMAVVFESPSSGVNVYVYVTGAPQLKLWTPDSGLTPSAIICTQSGGGSRADAMKLSRFGKVDAKVHYRNQAGSQGAGLALPGDRSGRNGPCAMYMLAYIVADAPGKTWFAPMSYGGEKEFVINGQKIVPSKINDKPGGVGQGINLTKGLNRLDAFAFPDSKGSAEQVFLMIRAPKDTIADLGGERPPDLKYPGTPRQEARHLRANDVARSGSCRITKIESVDGGPVAAFNLSVKDVFWFGSETPTLLYQLSALGAGEASKAQYSWQFSCDPGAVATGSKVHWLFPSGSSDSRVTLKVVDGDKKSECTIPFYPFSDKKSSIENPITREGFRAAVQQMITAYPANTDPVASWDPAMWNNLFRNLELGEGRDLLLTIFTPGRWDYFSKKLLDVRRELLEDLFFVVAPRVSPKDAITWADMLAAEYASSKKPTPSSAKRSVMLKLKAAEIYMYYLKDLDRARKVVIPLLGSPGDAGEMAKIRLGDIEFLSRTNMSAATRLYGEVQNKAQYLKAGEAAPVKKAAPVSTGLAKSKKELQAQKKPEPEAHKPAAGGGDPMAPNVAKWKKDAIRDVAASETIKNLIEQKFYLEAYQELKRWESGFPLSKISGDYILLEAKLYMVLRDYQRARVMMEAYCEQVDASNFLGEALNTIKDCMIYMNEPEDVVKKYLDKARKRMQFQGGLSF